jgi:hypothetical protein
MTYIITLQESSILLLELPIMLLESSIMLLELPIMLLENMYTTGITHHDCYMMIIVCF